MPAPQGFIAEPPEGFVAESDQPEGFIPEEAPAAPPKIQLSPYEQARMEGPLPPMGTLGPTHPEEVLALPQITQIPAALMEPVMGAIDQAATAFRRQTGLDPSAMEGRPAFTIASVPITSIPDTGGFSLARLIAPQFTKGVEQEAGRLLSGLTAPGQAELLPFAAAKPVQALFGLQAAAALPESIQQIAQARTPLEAGAAITGAAANLGVGASIAAHLLPQTSRAAVETLREKGPEYARQIETTAATYGNLPTPPRESVQQMPAQVSGAGVRPQAAPVAQEAQIPLTLTDEEQAYLDAERAGMTTQVEVIQKPLPPDAPFAKQIATIDRATGRILINPKEYSPWLKAVPQEQRQLAVKSLLSEEQIHLAVDDASAIDYWNNLTALEKSIERYRYTDRWTAKAAEQFHGRAFSDTDLGHEAIRFRLQQLARLTPREIAEVAGRQKWQLQAITALENTVRSIREKLATKASLQQLEILERIQEGITGAKAAVTGTPPSAIRKSRKEEGPELFLPPAFPSEQLERHVYPQPTPTAIEAAAAHHFSEAIREGKAPSFEDYQNELKGQYGSGIGKDALYYTWQDAMMNSLMAAKGSELEGLVKELELTGKLQAEHQQSFGKGSLADPIVQQGKQFVLEALTRPSKATLRARFTQSQRKRLAAIGAIIQKLTNEAGAKPEKPWSRKEVGPEEITQLAGERQYRAFTPAEQSDPATIGNIATRNAAVEATGKGAPPRTVSKNLIALRDKSGRVLLVSAWRDPRSGPRVTDPSAPSLPSRRIDPALLRDYTPLSVMTLREPAQGFHQTFPSQEAFAKWFGDVAIEGTPGIKTSSFAGPEAGTARFQAGLTGAAAPPPAEPGLPPSLTEPPFVSPTARELTTPGRPAIGAGMPLYRAPRPEPIPGEALPLAARQAVEARARAGFPYEPTGYNPSAELERRGIQIMPGARGERPSPAAINKFRQQAKDNWDVVQAGLSAAVKRRSVKKDIAAIVDGSEGVAAMFSAAAKGAIHYASEKPLAREILEKFRFNPTRMREYRAMQAEGAKVRSAVKAVIATGQRTKAGDWVPTKNFLDHLDNLLLLGEQRAIDLSQKANPLKALAGRRWLAAIGRLKESVDYARDNWDSPELKAAVAQTRKELHDTIEWENDHGSNVQERENYDPTRYEGSFWGDNGFIFQGRRLLGEQYRAKKAFANPYEAASVGPYILASDDVADLVEHRISQGHRLIERKLALNQMMNIKDPDSKQALAMEPEAIFVKDPITGEAHQSGWKVPKGHPEYVLVYPYVNSKPLAVRVGFEHVVSTSLSRTNITDIPFAREALVIGSMLKHDGLLLFDTYHLGRLLQYSKALVAGKPVGFEGGHSALTIRPQDMQAAIERGHISEDSAHWAMELVPVNVGGGVIKNWTRQKIAQEMVRRGLNAARITDALYRHAAEEVPVIGPILAPYNRWLFGKFVPGTMVEAAVRNFEKFHQSHPDVPVNVLMKDVSRDMNAFFGNMGRQGVFRSALFRNLAQMIFLAPMWQEGLLQKELRFYGRVSGISYLTGRRGVPYLGTLGEGMARGLTSYFVATQIINLYTRHHLTFQNPEAGHKLDAWIPSGSKGQGFWLSPLAVFGEVLHDVIRLSETKPRTWDVLLQMGANRLGPVGKMGLILGTGQSPTGEYYSTTGGVVRGALSQLAPTPISLAQPARALAHAVAPNVVSPPAPGAVQRQAIATLGGIKVQPSRTATQQMAQLAENFVRKEHLKKPTGWREEQTDEPSYTKFRAAVRNNDLPEARRQLKAIRKDHSDDQIIKAMELWARRPWTGSDEHEELMTYKLSHDELNLLTTANEEKMETLNAAEHLIFTER